MKSDQANLENSSHGWLLCGFQYWAYQIVSGGARLIVLLWFCQKGGGYLWHVLKPFFTWIGNKGVFHAVANKVSFLRVFILAWCRNNACCGEFVFSGFLVSVVVLVALALRRRLSTQSQGRVLPLESDAPVRRPEDDCLGRSAYVEALGDIVVGAIKIAGDHAVYIGVYGKWGEGKTTVRHLLENHLLKNANGERVVFVDFCPWEYGEKCDLRLELCKKLADAVKRASKGMPVQVFSQLVKLATFKSSEGTSGVLREFLDIFRGFWFSRIVKEEKLHARAKAALSEIGQTARIVVVVDDLDRVTPTEARRVVRFLKANGDLPNLVYLILADEEYLANAVAGILDKPPPGGVEYGREYLRKIVGISYSLPKISRLQLASYFADKLTALVKAYGLKWDDETHACEWVAGYLHTLRDVKLFLNEFSVVLANLKQRARDGVHMGVHLGDLLAIIALRSREPELYGHLQEVHSILLEANSPWHQVSESTGISLKQMENCCFKYIRPGGQEQVDVFLKDRLNIGPVEFEEHSHVPVRYGLTESESPDTIARCRLASEFHFDTYFHFDNEVNSLLDEGLDEFKQSVENGSIPTKILAELERQGLWPLLIGSLSGRTDWPPVKACRTYVRALIHMAGMPHRSEGDSDPAATALYRCLKLYADNMGIGTFSETSPLRRDSLKAIWTSAFLAAVRTEDDVQMSAHFLAWEEHCRSERGNREAAMLSEDEYRELKEGYLHRIEAFHKKGKLMGHPEFSRLFFCWVNGAKEENHLQNFRASFAKELLNADSVWKILGLFMNRRYHEDELGTYPLQIDWLEEAFGGDGLEKMAETLAPMAEKEGGLGTTARLLQWAVNEKKVGRPYDEQAQSNHLLAEMDALKAQKKVEP